MSGGWFFKTLGAEFGPISLNELQKMLQSGELNAEDEVRSEGSQDWQPVSSVVTENLPETSHSAPISVDSHSEQSLVDELLSHAEEIEKFDSLDEFVLEKEDDHSRQAASLEQFLSQHTNANQNSSAVSKSSEDDFELDDALPAGEMADWYAKLPKGMLGPLSFLELQTKISRGIVGKDDSIRQGKNASWTKATEFKEFEFPVLPQPTTPLVEAVQPVKSQEEAKQEIPEVENPVVENTEEKSSAPVAKSQIEAQPEPDLKAIQEFTAHIKEPKTASASQQKQDQSPSTGSTPAPLPVVTPAKRPAAQKNKTPIMAPSPVGKRSKVPRFDFDFSGGGVIVKYAGIAVVVAAVLYLGSFLMFGDPGVKYYHQLTDLWQRTKETYDADPDNFKTKSSALLQEAEEIMAEMRPIPNTRSRLFATVKTFGKDGILPYLKQTPTDTKREMAENYLRNAERLYNQ